MRVTLAPSELSTLIYSYSATFFGSADPLYEIETTSSAFIIDTSFFTKFGSAWTGQAGTFAVGCGSASETGICVHFDPDGAAGSVELLGPSTQGSVTITALGTSYSVTFSGVSFDRPGGGSYLLEPFTLAGSCSASCGPDVP
ncbi:MAG: hypothetical protein V3R95_03945 [Dehalococcoidia bacterium]